MADNTANKVLAVRAIMAMVLVSILALVALNYGVNGEILKLAIYVIALLGGTDVALEYYQSRKG